jgi:hypothetical protein
MWCTTINNRHRILENDFEDNLLYLKKMLIVFWVWALSQHFEHHDCTNNWETDCVGGDGQHHWYCILYFSQWCSHRYQNIICWERNACPTNMVNNWFYSALSKYWSISQMLSKDFLFLFLLSSYFYHTFMTFFLNLHKVKRQLNLTNAILSLAVW